MDGRRLVSPLAGILASINTCSSSGSSPQREQPDFSRNIGIARFDAASNA